jgi:3-hydroxyisobutyrate dehydrogenase-like beta-hydroxyacid dehydrogenase
MKVGFIGLGRMGQAMARRVLDAGHDLILYNRTPSKLAELAGAGAKTAGSIAEAAAHGGVVITMLADDAALASVGQTLVESLPQGGIHICSGTHGVAAVRALAAAHAAAGQTLVAAPVLGRPEVVVAGRLGIIVAGAAAAVERSRPLFEAIGRRTFEAGEEPEAAAAMKIANNFLLGCAMEAMGEAFSLVEKSGGAPGLFYEILTDGLFACPAYTIYGKMVAEETYDNVGFTTRLGLKDANLALSAGESLGVPLPSGSVWRDRLIGAIAHGDGEKDWSVIAREQKRASGLA